MRISDWSSDVCSSDLRTVEQEKSTMEIAYRRLEELLSEKGDRLIALGLVDAEDVAALMPHMGVLEDTRIGINFAEALPGGFAKLAPLLQARMAEQIGRAHV